MLPAINTVKATKGKSQYLNITNDLFNLYGNDPKLIPRSTYRKNVGEGIRAITYGAQVRILLLLHQNDQGSLLLTLQLQWGMRYAWLSVTSSPP